MDGEVTRWWYAKSADAQRQRQKIQEMARGTSYGRQRGGGGTVGGEVPGVDEDGEQAPAAESQPAEMAAEHEVQGSEDDSVGKRHLRKGQESSRGPAILPH